MIETASAMVSSHWVPTIANTYDGNYCILQSCAMFRQLWTLQSENYIHAVKEHIDSNAVSWKRCVKFCCNQSIYLKSSCLVTRGKFWNINFLLYNTITMVIQRDHCCYSNSVNIRMNLLFVSWQIYGNRITVNVNVLIIICN